MADINNIITLGIGTPGGIEPFLTFGLFPEGVIPAGWTFEDGYAVCDGTQTIPTSINQTLATETDVDYSIEIEITRTAGTLSVEWDGVELLSTTTSGTYTIEATAPDESVLLEIIADANFIGTVQQVKCKRFYWLESNYVDGSLSIIGYDNSNSPTLIESRYTDPSSTNPNWQELITPPVKLPGVDAGDVPTIETTLNLPGVYRVVEATNKANAKLQRLLNKTGFRWTTTDHGLRFRKGDVIQLKIPDENIDALVWVNSVTMGDVGLWKVDGFNYSLLHYPSDVPEVSEGTIPVGAIALLDGTEAPDGWGIYSAANNKHIVIAGNSYLVDDTGGVATHAGFSGVVTTESAHPSSLIPFKMRSGVFGTGSANVVSGAVLPPNHNHNFSTGTIDPNLYRREQILIIKEGTTASKFPSNSLVFGLPGIVSVDRLRITTYANRLLKAASVNANKGASSKTIIFSTGAPNTSVSHKHSTTQNISNREYDIDIFDYYYSDALNLSDSHDHDFSLSLGRNVKNKTIAMYGGTADYRLAPGDMLLWAGSLVSLPSDWYLCDGANGTVDYTDYYLKISPDGGEGVASGNNTITLSGSGSAVGHSHRAGGTQAGVSTVLTSHSNIIEHDHSINESDSFLPEYYALALIMYGP